MADPDFDLCIIGSGAGAAPVALTLAQAGKQVLVLEKGPWWNEQDFCKDELACCLRDAYKSSRKLEPQWIELEDNQGNFKSMLTQGTRWNFWNGNCVGGSSNFMSGFFHRLKPIDFRLRSEFGAIEGADVQDWPISYQDLEPYYAKVEREVGVSGRVVPHAWAEPRSTSDFPYPPLAEHATAGLIDQAAQSLGMQTFPTPRAILPQPVGQRGGCAYNGGYCGSTGCSTGAKGSARAALLDRAVATGNCQIQPRSMASRIHTDAQGRITHVAYFDSAGKEQRVSAKIYVVAAQAIESARLLLNSTGSRFPNGLANGSGQVGRNLLFAGGGAGSAWLPYQNFPASMREQLANPGTFINRSLQDSYVIDDAKFGPRQKGGTIDWVNAHPAPITRAQRLVNGEDGRLVWGTALKRKLEAHFRDGMQVKVEAFCDWLPVADSHVRLDASTKDQWGLPVARVRVMAHLRNLQVGWYLADKGAQVLKALGAEQVVAFASSAPPTNLQAGTCRFGSNPDTSVLDADCRAHQVPNLFVTDGSFMPTGGSVPYTLTIYANAFRVADKIVQQLGS